MIGRVNPHNQQQNFAERGIGMVKSRTNIVMNRSGAPAYCWLLCLLYVCFLLNRLSHSSLDHKVPLELLTGQKADISPLLQYYFYEKVYYAAHDPGFPSESTERLGRFVGFGENVGDAMTYKILTEDTKKIIYRSVVRSAGEPYMKNKRLEPEDDKVFIKSKFDGKELEGLPGFKVDDLIGRTFLTEESDDGEVFRGRIIKAIEDHHEAFESLEDRVRFLVEYGDGKADEIISYNEIVSHIERNIAAEEDPEEQYFKFREISGHQGPLNSSDSRYKGSRYNVLVEWETGESTYEPLDNIAADDPVTCAIYAKKMNLLDEPGWKRFKKIIKNQKKLTRMINQTRL